MTPPRTPEPAENAANAAVAGQRVLVVDDTATNRKILAVFLEKHGYSVDLAENGAQAVEMFAARPYDLVIMDVAMPVMDGYTATRRIKTLCGDCWVPVIILSALDKDENLVIGLDAGCDDYLAKPVNFTVLEAKLRSFSRALSLRRELEDAHRSLQAYHDEREAEDNLAAEIIEQILQRPGLADPCLRYWMNPASSFSGDIVAATATADDRFYVLLADATGHGLAAAISALPLLTQFYDSAAAGVPLGRIVSRINAQLCATLPVGRFIAAACVCLDRQGNAGELWLGGMPAALVLDPAGNIVRRITASNLPLGIDAPDSSDAATEHLDGAAYPPGSQLLLFSDGLLEAQNPAGEPFDMDGLCAALAGVPTAGRLDAIKDAVFRHLDAQPPHDDITVILVDLPTAAN